MRSNRYTVEQWGWGLVVVAFVLGFAPLIARNLGGADHHGMTHGDGGAAHAPHVEDPEAFCAAIGRLVDADLGSGAARAVTTGGIDGPGATEIESSVVPAIHGLHAVAPHEVHAAIDHAEAGYGAAVRLARGDAGARAELETTLAASSDGIAVPLVEATRAACAADELVLDLVRRSVLLGAAACPIGPAERTDIDGGDRLPTVETLTAVPTFGGFCPMTPAGPPEVLTSATAPCGGPLTPVDLSAGFGARYGTRLESLTEVIGRPGGTAAGSFVAQLNADVRAGCRPSGGAGFQDVQPAVVPGLTRAYAAFRATAAVDLGFPGVEHRYAITQTMVAVAAGDELLLLVVTSPSAPEDEPLAALVTMAVARAGW